MAFGLTGKSDMRMRPNFDIFFEITKMRQTFLFKSGEFREFILPVSNSDPAIAAGPAPAFGWDGSVDPAMILFSEIPFVFRGSHGKILSMHGGKSPVGILFFISNLILSVLNPEKAQDSTLPLIVSGSQNLIN